MSFKYSTRVFAAARRRRAAMVALMMALALAALWAGCARAPEADRDAPSQGPGVVLEWLRKPPHLAIWGCSDFVTEAEVRAAAAFDMGAWEAEGRRIPDVESVLDKMLEGDEASEDLARAAYALGKVGTAQSVPILIKWLDSEDGYGVQVMAAGSLGKLGDPRAVEPLAARLARPCDDTMLGCVIFALEQIGDRRAIETLRAVANKGDTMASELAKEALANVEGQHAGRKR